MRALIQRVNHASVSVEGEIKSQIKQGLLIFLGVSNSDTEKEAELLWRKISKLRIFDDENGKTNLSMHEVGGEVLIVSQFTLMGNCRKGNRPSFIDAGSPAEANQLYEYFVEIAKRDEFPVKTGCFQTYMHIDLQNDGPFTLWLDTNELTAKK